VSDSNDFAVRFAALEARVQRLEDESQIRRLIASYGPAVDSCTAEAVVDLWADGGTYELQHGGYTSETIHRIVESDLHLKYVAAGSAHVMTTPRITIQGDTAVVLNYSTVFVHASNGWVVDRAAANRWDLERTERGWKVRRRVNRLVDGSAAARDLLAGEDPPPSVPG
jgi:hypothetical protein